MTANDVETREMVHAPGNGIQREQIDLLKRTICVGATDDELSLFVATANRMRLDPFARQVFAVKRWDNNARREVMAIQVSIDGFRLVAERTGKYAGQLGPLWTSDGKEWVEVWLESKPPAAAKVGVLRHDFKEPVWAVATWDQYKQVKRDGGLTSMWGKMGPLMLAKCAESLALRRAFPNELSGVYSQEEMAQATPANDEVEYQPPGAPASKAAPPSNAAPPALVTPGVTSREGAVGQPGSSSIAAAVTSTPTDQPPPPRETTDPKAQSSRSMLNGQARTASDSSTGKRRDSGARDIPHDGNLCSSGQVTKLHVLRAKSPSLSATPDDPRSNWKKKLAPYKRQDGTPCQHSNELSVAQARHLIDWMQAKVDALEAKEREIRAGTDGTADNLIAVVAPEVVPSVNLAEAFKEHLLEHEERDWLQMFAGVDSLDDIREESRATVLQLLLAFVQDRRDQNGPRFTEALRKARALGHV